MSQSVLPSYDDLSLGFVETWAHRADVENPEFRAWFVGIAGERLRAFAAGRGAQLTGQPVFDCPPLGELPWTLRWKLRLVRCAFDPLPWRWPNLAVVRVWQDTTWDSAAS